MFQQIEYSVQHTGSYILQKAEAFAFPVPAFYATFGQSGYEYAVAAYNAVPYYAQNIPAHISLFFSYQTTVF